MPHSIILLSGEDYLWDKSLMLYLLRHFLRLRNVLELSLIKLSHFCLPNNSHCWNKLQWLRCADLTIVRMPWLSMTITQQTPMKIFLRLYLRIADEIVSPILLMRRETTQLPPPIVLCAEAVFSIQRYMRSKCPILKRKTNWFRPNLTPHKTLPTACFFTQRRHPYTSIPMVAWWQTFVVLARPI